MAKLYDEHQFFGWIGPVWLIEELRPYGLGLYGQFIALSQIFIGYCLVTTRYKLLGGIMMIPLIGNILMVTISLQWQGTPFVLAFLMVLNLILLWQYRDFFKALLDETDSSRKIKNRNTRSWQGHLVWLAGFSLQIFSILVSFFHWPLALGLVLAGLLVSLLSFRLDQISSTKHPTLSQYMDPIS